MFYQLSTQPLDRTSCQPAYLWMDTWFAHPFSIMNNAAVNLSVQISLLSSTCVCVYVIVLDHMPPLHFLRNSQTLLQQMYYFPFLPAIHKGSHFSTYLSTFILLCFSIENVFVRIILAAMSETSMLLVYSTPFHVLIGSLYCSSLRKVHSSPLWILKSELFDFVAFC